VLILALLAYFALQRRRRNSHQPTGSADGDIDESLALKDGAVGEINGVGKVPEMEGQGMATAQELEAENGRVGDGDGVMRAELG
jgi:hypothetical protein